MKPVEFPAERLAFGALVLIALIAHWPALQWGYGNDDYALLHDGVGSALFVSQGRPMGWVLYWGMRALGIPLAEASPAFQFAGNLALVAFAWTVVRLWAPDLPAWQCAMAALPIIVHPYQAEIFSYRSTIVLNLLPVALTAWFLHECRTSGARWRVLAATAGLVVAFATYQVVVNYLAYVLMLHAATIFALGGQRAKEAAEWRIWRRATVMVAVAALTYVVGLKLLWSVVPHASDERFDWRALPGLTERIGEMATWGNVVFFDDRAPLSGTVKWLALGIPVLVLVGTYIASARALDARVSRWRMPAALVVGFAAAWFLIGGVGALTPHPWIVPRVLAQAGLVYAWLFVLALSCLRQSRATRGVMTAFGAICVVFIAMSASVLSSQLRVNLRDLHQASRIFERLEATSGYAKADRLVVVGGKWAYADRIRNVWGDLNTSAFIAPQSKGNLIVEISGTHLVASTHAPDLDTARRYCEHAEPWPAPQSVTIADRLAIICMPIDL